jgi:hypothetical protein
VSLPGVLPLVIGQIGVVGHSGVTGQIGVIGQIGEPVAHRRSRPVRRSAAVACTKAALPGRAAT